MAQQPRIKSRFELDMEEKSLRPSDHYQRPSDLKDATTEYRTILLLRYPPTLTDGP